MIIVCWPNFSMAEDIQNMDTPVNWSYTALFHTIWDFHKDDDTEEYALGRVVAEELLYLYADEKRPVSARWICDNYFTAARKAGIKPHNCYDVIAKIIENHNTEVQLKTQLKPIDKYMVDEKVYWNTVAIFNACKEITDQFEKNLVNISSQIGREFIAGSVFEDCVWMKYNLDMYNKPYSINELYDYCTSKLYKGVECSAWIDFAIEQHNELVQNTQAISLPNNEKE